MSRTDPPDSSGGRRRGRPTHHGDPVTVVSISMPGGLLAEIDDERRNHGGTHRGRSSWVRWVLRSYIRLRRKERERLEEMADFGMNPDGSMIDPTHGGRFDPAQIDRPRWACPSEGCDCYAAPDETHRGIVGGWNECPSCGTTRPPEA